METTQELIPFTYSVNVLALAAASQTNVTLTLATDSYFELHYFVATTSADAPTDFSPNFFTVSIQINSGRFLMNNPVPQRIIAAPANLVQPEHRNIRFNPGDQLNFLFLNLVPDDTLDIFFGMKGYYIFV